MHPISEVAILELPTEVLTGSNAVSAEAYPRLTFEKYRLPRLAIDPRVRYVIARDVALRTTLHDDDYELGREKYGVKPGADLRCSEERCGTQDGVDRFHLIERPND